MAKLININERRLQGVLSQLHSVLDIPMGRASPVQVYHPSFRDFVLDNLKCSDPQFWVDEKQAHQMLAKSCIELMSTSLRKDICGLRAPGVLVADIASTRIEQCLPPEVRYACLYWIQHLQRGNAQLHDNHQVYQFLQAHLLHWLEALGWIGKTSEGILAVNSLEAFILVSLLYNISS